MNPKSFKPIPKYIFAKIKKLDNAECLEQKGAARMYSYLTTIQKELVKITVAVKNYKNEWYCKQVAAHGVKSSRCWVKDMEYVYCNGMGFRVGWHAEGLSKYPKWFEDGNWYDADSRYYNPVTKTVNPEYVSKFPEYRFSAYQYFKGFCIIAYLKLYERFPQVEYFIKLGLHKIYDSVTVLKRVVKDKKFCRWLISHRDEIASGYFYINSIMRAYKTGKPLKQVQAFEECKKRLNHDGNLQPIKELFQGSLERFFCYLEEQNTDPNSYLDYLKACDYLGLDMTLSKNRFPHDFHCWHDIRIAEYHSAKALVDEQKRAELYTQFAAVAQKYLPLQDCKKGSNPYAVFIAGSPAELIREGEVLKHCVGHMGYDLKVVRQESLIFFIRLKDQPKTPFVTVEYSLTSKKVLQCYGNGNLKPDDTVLTFVNKVWLPFANRTIRKMTQSATYSAAEGSKQKGDVA